MSIHLLTQYSLGGKSQTMQAQRLLRQLIRLMKISSGLAGARERALHWELKKLNNNIMRLKSRNIIRRRAMALTIVMEHMKVIIKIRQMETFLPIIVMKRTIPYLWRKLRLMKNLSLK